MLNINRAFKINLLVWLMLLFITSCKSGSYTVKEDDKRIDIKQEIEKWKGELVKNKQIGAPCEGIKFGSSGHKKWIKDYPDQYDGLPSDTEIKSVQTDLNTDGKEDVLLYLQGVNCTGHNGGVENFAKIIYSNGVNKSDLMNEIMTNIQKAYNLKKKTNQNLREISDDYLESTTTIDGYQNGVTGRFRLYAVGDPHCCPSYRGSYLYKVESKEMKIAISEY